MGWKEFNNERLAYSTFSPIRRHVATPPPPNKPLRGVDSRQSPSRWTTRMQCNDGDEEVREASAGSRKGVTGGSRHRRHSRSPSEGVTCLVRLRQTTTSTKQGTKYESDGCCLRAAAGVLPVYSRPEPAGPDSRAGVRASGCPVAAVCPLSAPPTSDRPSIIRIPWLHWWKPRDRRRTRSAGRVAKHTLSRRPPSPPTAS